jgi:DNA-binding MarR family transcriptional regulator
MRELENLASRFGLLYLRFYRLVDRRMAAEGASLARTKLLLYLNREGRSRAADIADLFGSAPRTITESIDALERDGFVRREPHPTDRRAKLISITEEGRRVIKSTEPLRAQLVESVFGSLTVEEREQFGAAIEKNITMVVAQQA